MPPAPLVIPERDVPSTGTFEGVASPTTPSPPGSPLPEDLVSPAANDAVADEAARKLRGRASIMEVPETGLGFKFPRTAAFVRSDQFESWIGVCILFNCLTIGIEVNNLVQDDQAEWLSTFAAFCEHFFTFTFLTEFMLRVSFVGPQIYAPGFSGNTSTWDACCNLGDAGFVWITGVFIVWIAPVVGIDVGRLRIFTVVRAVRLMRLVRVVRKMPQFSEAYLLIRGLSDSLRTLFWTCLVIFFITYIFAIFGVVTISVHIKTVYEEAQQGNYHGNMADLEMLWACAGSLDGWMYTLVQVLTLDSWTGISRPMEEVVPGCWFYFYLYIVVAAIVFLNLVTAVIVENALENSKADEDAQLMLKEEQNKKLFNTFQQLFVQMDDDDDGELTAEEFDVAFKTPEVARKLKLLDFKQEECVQLFGLLDEGDGTLTLEEFFYGLQQMKGEASAKEVYMLAKNVDRIWQFLVQFTDEADQDAQALFKALGLESAMPPYRDGTILKRSKDAVRAENERKNSDSPLNSAKAGNKDDPFGLGNEQATPDGTGLVSFPQMATQIQELVSYLDGVSKNLNSQFDVVSTRLVSVEENSASANALIQQLIGPLEPKLKGTGGRSLGRCCAT